MVAYRMRQFLHSRGKGTFPPDCSLLLNLGRSLEVPCFNGRHSRIIHVLMDCRVNIVRSQCSDLVLELGIPIQIAPNK